MMSKKNQGILVQAVGAYLYSQINSHQGTVIGVTSNGFFIQAADLPVFFISREKYQGPLTVNSDSDDPLAKFELKEPVLINRERILFPGSRTYLEFSEVVLYESALNLENSFQWSGENAKRTREMMKAGLEEKPDYHLRDLFLALLEETETSNLPPSYQAPLERLIEGAKKKDNQVILEAAANLYGLGPGLTPSGDDILLGFLLGLDTSNKLKDDSTLADNLVQPMLAVAEKNTNAISAALNRCAAAGEADERLISLCRYIILGDGIVDDCITGLASWGNTSGFDTLAGIAISNLYLSPT